MIREGENMNKNSFYTEEELKTLCFRNLGANVLISRKASIYSPETMSIGSNVRIDDFCILTGKITIGSFVHISAYVGLFGKLGIKIMDFANVSMRTTILSTNDDFTGEFMTGSPVLPDGYSKTTGGLVTLKKHANIGAGCLVFPNITIAEGTAVGSMSLINKSTDAWTIYYGIPCRPVRKRKTKILELEKKLIESLSLD
jgi:galactoside O-acetyltransferase